MRHRVELQSAARSQATFGKVATVWSTFATVWARVEPMAGGEALSGDQVQSRASHKITIRYNSTLTTNDRIRLTGWRAVEIHKIINPQERNIYLEVEGTEIPGVTARGYGEGDYGDAVWL